MLDGELVTNAVPKFSGGDSLGNIKNSSFLAHNLKERFQDSDCNSRIRTQALLAFSFQFQANDFLTVPEGIMWQSRSKGELKS
jgi:hypothetical protein